ncbi:putative mediator of RNA polymerase II transcription subunit 21 [Culicoides brevitarsis]|uniref:putative mediator of RNA polymerase II transcription subunit 21 n=1 Tax=Culicoides brevitarsis TaxID=469753 RepID=UPI00307C6854
MFLGVLLKCFSVTYQSIALFIALAACIVYTVSAQDDKRSALLQRRNIGGRPGAKGTSTTAAPAEPDYEDEDYNEQENQAAEKQEQQQQQNQEQETTTTEAPKRIMPSVRPFRSNDDLLAALKKRRQQVKSQPQQQPKTGK